MKRREFITLASIAAALPPKSSFAAPCPPAFISTNGGNTSTKTLCPSTAPAWFENITANSWIEIAGGANFGASYQNGSTIRGVSPKPADYPNGQGAEGVSAVTNVWTGACTYQSGGEYLLPSQGGHNAYYSNEVYSLALRQAVPTWRRIWGPTPNAQILTSEYFPNYNPPYTGYEDGAPRTSHGWYSLICTAAGRIITTLQDANPSGTWDTGCYSLDVNNPNLGWTFHGRLWTEIPGGQPGSTFAYQSGPGAYDPVSNKFYRAAEGAVGNGAVGVDVSTMLSAGGQSKVTGPQVPGSILYDLYIPGGPLSDGWSVILDDMSPRCWVVGSPTDRALYIMDLSNPTKGFVKKLTTGSPDGFAGALGAAYHKSSKSILVGGKEIGNNIRRLNIVGNNPLTAAYTWTNLPLTGSTPKASPQYAGTFSKFQMIEDMGNGQSAVVMATNVDGPTYVAKIALPNI